MQDNHTEHRAAFEVAFEDYRKEAIKQLERVLSNAKAGRPFDHTIGLVIPQNHSEDYERSIKMLELSEDEIFEVTSEGIGQYIRDDWGWKQRFTATNSRYG